MTSRHHPVTITPTGADALRAALTPWTVDSVAAVVGERAMGALSREQILPALIETRRSRDAIATLTRALMLGDTVTVSELDAALPGLKTEGAARLGLVHASGNSRDDAVRALVDLRPYTAADGTQEVTWWLASDQAEAVTGTRLADDHVLGTGGASTTLASATIRAAVTSVLDLGTGCGIQALHASSHASRITATDISKRALSFATFNKALNAPHSQWDIVEGSLLEPVEGQSFDLIVSNPPFVITPPGAPSFEYRDGGAGGDAIVSALVSGIGAHLNPGGVAQLLGNWEIPAGVAWSDRLEQWLEGGAANLDAWIIQRDVLDPAQYAEIWLRDAGVTPERDRAAFEAAYEHYLADFDSRGVEGIGFGIITLRKPADASAALSLPTSRLRRLEEHEGALPSPLGPHLAASLAAHDWCSSRDDDALLASHYVVASDVTTESYARPGASDPEHILIRQGGGFGRAVKADTALAGFVGACDGELTAGQIAGALAALLDVPTHTMRSGLAVALRDLMRDGFVAPVP